MKKTNKKGFTLTEILAVVVIVGLLAGLISAGVIRYVNSGKEEYNDKLKKQLVLAGKTYYSNNKTQLIEDGSGVVSLPEMQSKNYITNDFVDSEGRECSPSFVYARRKTKNSKDFEYYGCLICQDEQGNVTNYSSDEIYCNITNWSDDQEPTCSYKKNDYGETNPSRWMISDATAYNDKKIVGIIIRNKITDNEQMIDVRNKDISEIRSMNIKDEFTNNFDITEVGEYEVVLLDSGGNESDSCMDFATADGPVCRIVKDLDE